MVSTHMVKANFEVKDMKDMIKKYMMSVWTRMGERCKELVEHCSLQSLLLRANSRMIWTKTFKDDMDENPSISAALISGNYKRISKVTATHILKFFSINSQRKSAANCLVESRLLCN